MSGYQKVPISSVYIVRFPRLCCIDGDKDGLCRHALGPFRDYEEAARHIVTIRCSRISFRGEESSDERYVIVPIREHGAVPMRGIPAELREACDMKIFARDLQQQRISRERERAV